MQLTISNKLRYALFIPDGKGIAGYTLEDYFLLSSVIFFKFRNLESPHT